MPDPAAPTAKVLVVGDVNPDLLLRGDVTPAFGQREQLLDAAELVIGGSAGITAHGLARLGRPVALLAAIGADALGAGQRRDLAAAGVDVDPLVERADLATGVTIVLSRGDDRAILTYPGTIPTLTAAEVDAAIEAAAGTGVTHVHVASLYLQPQLVAHLPDVLSRARAAGCTVSLDTNDDPAGTWLGVAELLAQVDVLLPNRNEVLALAGSTTTDPQDAAHALARRGPLVVVKDGAAGAFAVSPDGTLESAAGVDATVVDSTGAGDSFDAAFLDAWSGGAPLAQCLALAVRAGACVCRCRRRHRRTTDPRPTDAPLPTEHDPETSMSTHVAREIAGQPDVVAARPRPAADRSATRCRRPASASPCWDAARRGSWPRPTPSLREQSGSGETDAFAASRFPAQRATTGSWPSPARARRPRCCARWS